MKKQTIIKIISLCIVLLFIPYLKGSDVCDLDSKYMPGDINALKGENYDFLKAIWDNGIVQDYHIVIKDCKIKDIYSSSKKFNMSEEEYLRLKKLHNHIN